MADERRRSESGASADDSFDALLKQAAHLSGPALSSLGLQLHPGSTLFAGRLRVVRRIGEGGMGVVYEAHDERRRGTVALKTLNRLDAANVYRLKHEFRSLADVSHPNLCRLHELFGEGEQWFFTMELVEGERFDRWVRSERTLDESRLRMALAQLCEGVFAIHAAGKLHRDLKPSNVLVTQDGRVVVLDFGLAVDPEQGVGQTLLDEGVSGTPAYMAPEQAAGRPATAASDFYALGVMLFEALTGKLPFDGRIGEMLAAKQQRNAPAVSSVVAQAPGDLASLCDALLAREPALRPDAATLRTALAMPGASGGAERSSAAPERELLLGREAELAQLRAAYEATRAGQPVVMFVSGESGMGKSALVAHFLDELRAQGHAAVLAGRCYERESVPFKGIDSLVDDLSRLLRRLPRADAVALMPREVSALTRLFPVLGRIEVVAQAPKKDIADPKELRMRAFAAFCELLGRVRDRQPLVLHIDDAQWLDGDAVTFLGYVLGQHEPVAMLLLLSHRSEGAPDHALLAQVDQHVSDNARLQRRELSLGPLPAEQAQMLAHELLGAQGAARAAEIALEASGSPFFVGELARQARRTTAGARLTLHETVIAHVQALEPGARALLEVLAVAGWPLGERVALDAASAGHEHIDALHAERLLRRNGGGHERGVECYHDKIRESVAQALPVERARAIHASLLGELQKYEDADPEHLALHAQGAGNPKAAARYAEQGALRASAAMAFERAAALYARALELGEHAETERRELRTKLGEALTNAGRGADAARVYLDAAQGAAEAHALELKRRAAEQLLISGRVDDGKALLGEVLEAVGLGLPRTPRKALLLLGWERARLRLRGLSFDERKDALPDAQRRELDVLWTAARGLAAVDMFTGAALSSRYARLALDSGLPEHAARALASEAWFASANDGSAAKVRSDALLERSDVLARASASLAVNGTVALYRGMAAWMQGDAGPCHVHCKQAVETLRDRCTGVAFELSSARLGELSAAYLIGDLTPAAELASLIDDAWRRGDRFTATMLTTSSTHARMIQGDLGGVRRHLELARRLWQPQRQYNWPEYQLFFAQVLIALYVGDPQRIVELMRAEWPAIVKNQFLRSPPVQLPLRASRSSSALRVARLGGSGAPAARALARSDLRALARTRNWPPATARVRLLNAAFALDEGRPEQAVSELRAAAAAFDALGQPISVAAVRRRLGQLVGGDEGAALVAQAEAVLRAMGAMDLDATTRLLTLGIEVT